MPDVQRDSEKPENTAEIVHMLVLVRSVTTARGFSYVTYRLH